MNVDDRITQLEVYISHQEQTIADLSDEILQQQNTIKALELRLSKVENKIKDISTDDIKQLSEETPPSHY